MANKKEEYFVKLKLAKNLLREQQACQINAIHASIFHVSRKEIEFEKLKKIFRYDEDGASNEQHRFQRFNNFLNDNKIPYRTRKDHFAHINETFTLLRNGIPVPIFFHMDVLELIKDQFKSGYKFNIGEKVYSSNNKHILLLVGYEGNGERLLFLDPVYQLPYFDKDVIEKNDMLVIDFKKTLYYYRDIKSYIGIELDIHRSKRFFAEKKRNTKEIK